MKTIDAKGKLCPIPLIMTKKAINELKDLEILKILIDNEISFKNVVHFLNEYKMNIKTEQKANEFTILVSKTANIPEEAKPEEYCTIPKSNNSDYIIVINSDKMGKGSDELGEILMKAFVNTLPEIDNLPQKIIFYNSGILLCSNSGPSLDALKRIEISNVDILVCGTCLDYYGKKDALLVGRISNMYDILDSMSKATKIVFA